MATAIYCSCFTCSLCSLSGQWTKLSVAWRPHGKRKVCRLTEDTSAHSTSGSWGVSGGRVLHDVSCGVPPAAVKGPVEADPEYRLIVDANNLVVEVDNESSECLWG